VERHLLMNHKLAGNVNFSYITQHVTLDQLLVALERITRHFPDTVCGGCLGGRCCAGLRCP